MTEAASHLPATEVEDFAFHHSSPHSLRDSFSSPPAPPLIGNTPDDYDYDAANDIIDDALADNELFSEEEQHERRISGHSSVSSFPASVIQHRPQPHDPATPTRTSHLQEFRNGSAGSFADQNLSPRLGRGFGSAFRNPSSVKAMQMRDDDTESVITPHHKRSGSRLSARSHGSAYSTHTSPSKRQSRSNQTSPLKSSKLKKEFPLVLLHCTLLAPASSTMPVNCDSELYAALLPEEYQKRWHSLQDRLADPETKARGVLIPHPHDDYELLEERLLESLELQNPRIKDSHFFRTHRSGGDSGFESASQTEDESSDEAGKDARCPDCGKCLHLNLDGDRKWEIKVFAANGLMRAGAWAAAWREMEQVDIEISLAMPDDIRREVNGRLDALKLAQEDTEIPPDDESLPVPDSREREIYGSRPASGGDSKHAYPEPFSPVHERATSTAPTLMQKAHPMDMLRDRKNIIIVLLSVLVLFYAMTGVTRQPTALPGQSMSAASPSSQTQTRMITSTSVLTSTTTVEKPSSSSLSGIASPIAAVVQDTDTSGALGGESASESSPAEGLVPESQAVERDDSATESMMEEVKEE